MRVKSTIQLHTTIHDSIKRMVELDELSLPDRPRELRPDYRPHPCSWSETAKRAFNTDVYKFMAP